MSGSRPPAQPKDWREQTIHGAMVRVMRDVSMVGKEQRNVESPDQFMYRGIDALVNAVGPVLRKHGVYSVPKVLAAKIRLVNTSSGQAVSAGVKVRYRFYGPQGDYVDVVVPGEAMDYGDKATNKAMSVAWRTALIHVFSIPTGEPDPDAASYRRTQQDRAAEGSQEQRRPQGDPRAATWDRIIRVTTEAELPRDWSIADFRVWSGGHEINAPIATTTLEMVGRYLEELPGRIAAMRAGQTGEGAPDGE